ncbi:Ig-like domain-containing protein [Williamsia sp. CHRR-6]|uniref:L,D-transpeptidase n=1 Tax=Williamsia sp. CHRR-6 TaxID=2835871 RepID=UPI001BDAD893|nr:Ig-like domain-containing protein [Williamsia sp. CHRR-6]MBT0568275.1 L,D-transpeptidase family protein [Williamsia sp. CHRR-6]
MVFGLHGGRNRWTSVGIGMVVVASLAACSQSAPAPRYSNEVATNASFDDLLRPSIVVTGFAGQPLRDRMVGVQPGAPITVRAAAGELTDVRIPTANGRQIKGTFNSDRTAWTSVEPFGFDRTYTLSADVAGITGTSSTKLSFTTRAPNNVTDTFLLPENNSTVGIGQPVAIRFDEPITDKLTAQRAIKVTTNPPVEGAFYWLSDSELRWRPQNFWKPGTKVHVDVNTYGIDLGDGLFGEQNKTLDFTVGRSLIATADDRTKQVVVNINGKTVRSMPTSMGKDSTPTNRGTYIVGDRVPSIIMDSSTYGVPVNSPGGYRETVYFDTQMSWSGIYLHAAPWSLYAQGNSNVSNGCLNLSPENAEWFMNTSLRGDIVIVKNTVGDILPGNDGLGDWNIPWDVWKRGNAGRD